METQRLLLYLAFGFLSLILYQSWMQDYHAPAPVVQTSNVTTQTPVTDTDQAALPSAADLPNAATSVAAPVDVPTQDPLAKTVDFSTDVIDGSISTVGATITRIELKDYPISIDQPDTSFLLMSDDPAQYLVGESGLQARANEPAPTHREIMSVEADSFSLEEGQDSLAIPFTWVSDNGITVTKTLTFYRGSYQVDLDYQITNGSGEDWTVNQYRQLKRKPGTSDEKQQFVNTYIGAVVSNAEDRYAKISFGDMEDENLSVPVTDGWVAMIEHYFAAAWVPSPGEVNTAYSRYLQAENRYLIGMVSASQVIPAGGQGSFSSKAYIGPKIQDNMAAVAEHLELTVDFGWLTILAQPLFWVLKTIHSYIGNWGWAIIFTTFIIKAVFYKLLLESVELRQAPFMLWIQDLSIKDPFFILPVIMAATMYFQQKLNPAPVDPIQAKVFQFLPLVFGIFFAFFPAGLVLYWVVNNTLSIAQQYYITRHVLGEKKNKKS